MTAGCTITMGLSSDRSNLYMRTSALPGLATTECKNLTDVRTATFYAVFCAASLLAILLSTIPTYWVMPPGVRLTLPPPTLYVAPFRTSSSFSEVESVSE